MPTPPAEQVTLGDKTFEVRRPKLGQLRYVVDALDAMAGKSSGGLIDGAVGVLVAGLAPAHPDIKADDLLDIEATMAELNAAVATVLRTAGLQATDAGPGEAGP